MLLRFLAIVLPAAGIAVWSLLTLWSAYREAMGLRRALHQYCVSGSIHGPDIASLKYIADADTSKLHPFLSPVCRRTLSDLSILTQWSPQGGQSPEIARRQLEATLVMLSDSSLTHWSGSLATPAGLDSAYALALQARIWIFLAANDRLSSEAQLAQRAYATLANALGAIKRTTDRVQLNSVTFNGLGTLHAMQFREGVVAKGERPNVNELHLATESYARAVSRPAGGDPGPYSAERRQNNETDLQALLFYAYVTKRNLVTVERLPPAMLQRWQQFADTTTTAAWLAEVLPFMEAAGARIRHPVVFLTAAQLRATAATYFRKRNAKRTAELLNDGLTDLSIALSLGVVGIDIGTHPEHYMLDLYFTHPATKGRAAALARRFQIDITRIVTP